MENKHFNSGKDFALKQLLEQQGNALGDDSVLILDPEFETVDLKQSVKQETVLQDGSGNNE